MAGLRNANFVTASGKMFFNWKTKICFTMGHELEEEEIGRLCNIRIIIVRALCATSF